MAQATAVVGGERRERRASADPAPRPGRRSEWRRTLALFLCFAGFYLLTTSGHFYAVDEETNYVLAESMGVRGTFELPRGAWGLILSPQSPAPGPAYSIFPPGQPLAVLPLLFLGRLLSPLFPPDQLGYILRFCVAMFNPLVTAAMVALLYRLARLLGYSGRVALGLAVIYGLATTAWPQGRTFFAEPLTALLLIGALYCMRQGTERGGRAEPGAADGEPARSLWGFSRAHALWLALAGAAAVASLTVKPHAAIALPALGLYLLGRSAAPRREGGRWAIDRPAALRAIVAFGVGGAIVAVPYAALNLALFGGPLSTGYGTSPLSGFTHPFLRGLYGLTIATGRGIFWFSPPLILAVIGARRFYRQHRAEALACLGVVVSHYAFYCGHFEWAGGGAWGPRYLMIALPFALLPLLSYLEMLRERRVWVALGGVVVLAGFYVQLLPVVVNIDFYMIGDEEEHNFVPAASPLLWHTRTFISRVEEWRDVTFPPPNTAMLRQGFATRESEHHATVFPRWTNGAGQIEVYPAAREGHLLKITFFDHRPAAQRTEQPTILINGAPLAAGAIERQPTTADGEGWTYQFAVPAEAFDRGHATVTLRSATWNPAKLGQGDRDENLGVFVHNVEAWRDGQALVVTDIPEVLQIDPMPNTPRWRFWWFNNDYIRHHLLDTWWWYAAVAGFPRDFTIRWIGSVAGLYALITLAGLILGLRALPAGVFRPAPRRRQRGRVRAGTPRKAASMGA